jgi:outer membrane protein assembly factor BamB
MQVVPIVCLCLGVRTAALAQDAGPATAPDVAPGPAAQVFTPIAWPAEANDPGARRAADAVKALESARDSLFALLDKRTKTDAASTPGLDVMLDLHEPFLIYSGYILRPIQGVDLPWRTNLEKAGDRIVGTKVEFQPVREDARLTLQRRGGLWHGPELGMLSAKTRQQFHVAGSDASALKADLEGGVSGGLALTTAHGDFRFDMHMAGEHCDQFLPEYGNGDFHIGFGDGFIPDWWGGPRERLHPWDQRFALRATERRGWVLRAVLGAPTFTLRIARNETEVFLWVDEGRVLRGWLGKRDRPFQNAEYALWLDAWELKDKTLAAELTVRTGETSRRYSLRAELAVPAGGAFTGQFTQVRGEERTEGVLGGILYRAFTGAYETDGLDGKVSREVLAGVAPAPTGLAPLPPITAAGGSPAEQAFRKGLALYRHVAALDRALREYPLPLSLALREADAGVDNRFDYWAMRVRGKSIVRPTTVTVPEHLHEALAAEISPDANGAAAYLEDIVRIAQRTLADRQANTAPVIGARANPDPDFGPFGLRQVAVRAPAGGNRLPDKESDWRLLGDWTCFGVLPRSYSFDSAPYLPELAVRPGWRSLAQVSTNGVAVRLAHPNEMEHLWVWRAEPGDKDGRVTMSRTLLTPTREKRDRWGTNYRRATALFKGGPLTAHTGVSGDTMDFFYQLLVSWYATTTLQADKAERIWLAAAADWDGRVWVNGSLVWRPDRRETPNQVAVFPVDLVAGPNQITVCCSARPTMDGNMGNMGSRIHKYAERTYGSFSVWAARGGAPRAATDVAALAAKESAADAAARQTAAVLRGHRGDGGGCFPDARPPVAWDLEKKINVRWSVPLPTRDVEPVIVGKSVFVTTLDGGLACLDADTGTERWRKTPVVNGAAPVFPPLPSEMIGVTYDRDVIWDPPGPRPYRVANAGKQFTNACLTAMADAQRVWVQDRRGLVACFKQDGTQVWATPIPPQVLRMASGQECSSRTVPPVPPAMAGPWLVAAAADGLVGLDRETGAEKWRRTGLDFLGRFATMHLGDGPRANLVLLCSGEVLDAATGETLIMRCAPQMSDSACLPVVDGRVAYFHAGSAAVRFWVGADGELRSRLLWDSPVDIRKRGSDINSALQTPSFAPTPVLWRGLLLNHMAEMMSIQHGPQNSMRFHVSDAATGCAVAQLYCVLPNGMRPANSTIVAGDFVYCADRGGKTFGNYPAFPETPRIAVLQACEVPRRLATNPGLDTLSHPVADGRRIYLAGADQVVCIERPAELGDKFSEFELAALKEEFFTLEIGAAPTERATATVIAPLAKLPAGARTPVVPMLIGTRAIPWDKSKAPMFEGFPWQMLGAWPLPDQPLDDPYAAISGGMDRIVVEGAQAKVGDASVPFRPLTAELFAVGKSVLEYSMLNYIQAAATYALNTTNLFTGARPARGLFASVLDNRRAWTLKADVPQEARLWLNGQSVKHGDYVQIQPGYYAFLMEVRVTAETGAAPIGTALREFPTYMDWAQTQYNPVIEPQQRLERIRRNQTLLRAIAASGPSGAYAQESLDALESGSRPAGK